MELLAELSQQNLIKLLHEIKGRKVPDVLVARMCGVCPQVIPRWREGSNLPRDFDRIYLTLRGLGVCPQVIPRWREGSNLPRDFDRIYLTLRGLSAVAQGGLTAPAATVEVSAEQASQPEIQVPWQWWHDHYERERIRIENLESPEAEPAQQEVQEPWQFIKDHLERQQRAANGDNEGRPPG